MMVIVYPEGGLASNYSANSSCVEPKIERKDRIRLTHS